MVPELAGCFTGTLAHFADAVRVDDGTETLDAVRLLDADALKGLFARFAEAHPGGERRALVSMWSQRHFSAVVIPATVAIVLARRTLPIGRDGARLALHGDGRTAAIVLPDAGRLTPAAHQRRFAELLDGHLAPLIGVISDRFQVSARLLWTNAAVSFAWALRQCAERPDADQAALDEGESLLAAPLTPTGARNPLHGALRPSAVVALDACQRRVCCLRYLLPGIADCGSFCPIPAPRRVRASAG